jgi:hypothetical protein
VPLLVGVRDAEAEARQYRKCGGACRRGCRRRRGARCGRRRVSRCGLCARYVQGLARRRGHRWSRCVVSRWRLAPRPRRPAADTQRRARRQRRHVPTRHHHRANARGAYRIPRSVDGLARPGSPRTAAARRAPAAAVAGAAAPHHAASGQHQTRRRHARQAKQTFRAPTIAVLRAKGGFEQCC